ncbi:MAG: imidazole glycerol phosphate synthase subunit HisH [SAR324 cluster bacterium]|jgi:glutamine amidotransferase|tara:strand:- start:1090 stop:1692 length:603 start_codon:yes stop_codon:yes gene_type:complete
MNVIIDYKVGNLHNLKNALDFSSVDNRLVSVADDVRKANRILLPGVGAFAPAMEQLRKSGMLDVIQEKVEGGTPLLGICVGAQLLMDQSEEDGTHVGLGWIPGKVKRFNHQLKIPQMGWNEVSQQKEDPLFQGVDDMMHFYFVHSYHLLVENSEHVLGLSSYGYDFASVVRKDNLWGVQFHPEKSQNVGLQLLKNFCTLT